MSQSIPLQICEKELNALNNFQKQIHFTETDEQKILTPFIDSFVRNVCYSMPKIKMAQTNVGKEKQTFIVDCTMHLLADSYLLLKTPTFEVVDHYKDRVRISLCHNFMHNIIKECQFEEDGIIFNKFDNYWYDIQHQFLQDFSGDAYSKRKRYSKDIGNIKDLETFGIKIPSFQLGCNQPFFYSNSSASAYPIYRKNTLSRARHTYTFNLDYQNLIRIQVLKNDEWINLDCKKIAFKDFISVKGDFQGPEMYGCYIYFQDSMIQYLNCASSSNNKRKDGNVDNFLYITDMVSYDSNRTYRYGDNAEPTKLLNLNPCLALFWMAENVDSRNLNNYSNYTTNTNNHNKGYCPVVSHSLTVNNNPKFTEYETIHFTNMEPIRHFPTVPYEKGYYGFSFAWNIPKFGIDYGVIFNNDTLTCHLENTDPYINDNKISVDEIFGEIKDNNEFRDKLENRDRELSPEFRLICRALVLKKISFIDDNRGGIKIIIE